MKRWSLDAVLGLLALLTFAATRLIGLAQYPIYFFTDEAASTVLAVEFLDNGFRAQFGELFPTYFQNGLSLNLSTSVYAQMVPYLIFGKSIFVTRAVVVFIAVTGTLAVGLIVKHIFKSRWWWTSILLLSLTPAWFLHSRTAFEAVLWVSFFAWFLYFYLRYRTKQPKYLITTIVFGALSFYSYNGGQLSVVTMGLLLLVVDWRYHLQQRRIVLMGLAVAIVCVLPYVRFQIAHTAEVSAHLQLLGSYWMQDLPLGEKLARAAQEYGYGLRPDYWFAPDNSRDLIRHQLKGYGNLLWVTLPFVLLGLIIAGKNVVRRPTLTPDPAPAYRAVLLALLVAPISGVLVQANVLRDLVMVIPATLLTTIGLAAVLGWIVQLAVRQAGDPVVANEVAVQSTGAGDEISGLQHRAGSIRLARFIGRGAVDRRLHRRSLQPADSVAIVVCAMLIFANLFLLHDALTNGATWYDNYGLTGLQYGGPQVFTAIRDYLEREPQAEVWLFPSWLNGSEMLKRYFLPNDPRVELLDFDGFLADKFDLTDQTVLVMDHANYQRLIDSGKFVETQIGQTLYLPNGSPGYHLLTARYSPNIDQLLQQERQALDRADVIVRGELWQVSYAPLQNGVIQNLFDADPNTAVSLRGLDPAIIDITLPEPRSISGLTLASDSRDLQLAIEVYADRAAQAGRYENTFNRLRPNQPIEVVFDPPPGSIKRVRLTIQDIAATDTLTLRDLALNFDH